MTRVGFQRYVARIALLAMMALTLLPTIGRFALEAGDASASNAARFGAICTSGRASYDSALARREVAAFTGLSTASESPDAPPPSPQADADCDYCTLNAVAPIALLTLPSVQIANRRPPRRPTIEVRRLFHPNGLGSRGPPR